MAFDQSTMGLLALSGALMQASGPSKYPVPFGPALGNAYANFSKDQQTQALVDLEKQKAALAAMQVAQGQHQMNMQGWALGGMQGPMPVFQPPKGLGFQLPSAMPAMTPPTQQAPQPAAQPSLPAAPGQQPITPAGFNLSMLPPDARNAAQMDIAFNGGKGLPGIIQNSTTKVIPQVGMVTWDPVKQDWVSTEGFTNAMRGWKQAEKDVENQNTPVDVALPALPPGLKQRMTRAQELQLLNPSNAAQLLKPEDRAIIEADMKRSGIQDANLNFRYPQGAAPNMAIRGQINSSGAPGLVVGTPTTVATESEARGRQLSEVEKVIDDDARNSAEMRSKIAELRALVQDFTPNKGAPLRQTILEWKNSAPSWLFGGLNEKEMNEAGSLAGFGKIALGMAANATRQLGAREAAQIFDKMQQANPSIAMNQGALDKVMGFMDSTAQLALDKQSAKETWKQSHGGTLEGFEADWNKRFSGKIQSITQQAKALEQASRTFDAMPNPVQFKGKVIRDTNTGQLLKSDGMRWAPLK